MTFSVPSPSSRPLLDFAGKRGLRCSIWWSTRWGSQLSLSRMGHPHFNSDSNGFWRIVRFEIAANRWRFESLRTANRNSKHLRPSTWSYPVLLCHLSSMLFSLLRMNLLLGKEIPKPKPKRGLSRDWVGGISLVHVFFGVISHGRERAHEQIHQKIPWQSCENCIYVFS